jgi:hypothetical protein
MTRFVNSRAAKFVDSLGKCSLDDLNNTLTARCRFNFSYFTVQAAGQDFADWSGEELAKLFGCLRQFSGEPLSYWLTQPSGKKGTVYSHYGRFPAKSEFEHPKHVPHQAEWGRFRLNWASRLVGFTVPREVEDQAHPTTGKRYCCNTFYVVFLDSNHKFWASEQK